MMLSKILTGTGFLWALLCSIHGFPLAQAQIRRTEADAKRPVIYQLVLRHFGNTNSTNAYNGTIEENGTGKFSSLSEKALQEIRSMGVTHIWLTGVIQHATLTDYSAFGEPADDPDIVKGRAGSFFAIKDYFDVSPDYADDPARRLEEFRALVSRVHAAGMKVVIDLVANHVARSYGSSIRPELDPGKNDNPSEFLSLSNDFVYIRQPFGEPLRLPSLSGSWRVEGMDGFFAPETGESRTPVHATGNRSLTREPSSADWYETILLNYGFDFLNGRNLFSPLARPANGSWQFMDEVIKYWTTEYGVDGFRADFAHWVPEEAWNWLITRAKLRRPGLFFIAEAYANQKGLLASGFDAVYDDETYDTLKAVQNRTKNLWNLRTRHLEIGDAERSRLVRYLENHDERRFASQVIFDVDPDKSGFGDMQDIRLFGPIQYLMGGGPILVYNGQTVGEDARGYEGFDSDNGKTSIFDYWQPSHLARWYNGGEFGFAQLSPEEIGLKRYYTDLLKFAADEEFTSDRFYLLDQAGGNDLTGGQTAFARFVPESGRIALVVSNFDHGERSFRLRIPADLALRLAALEERSVITLELNRDGLDGRVIEQRMTRQELIELGLMVQVPARTSVVYSVDSESL